MLYLQTYPKGTLQRPSTDIPKGLGNETTRRNTRGSVVLPYVEEGLYKRFPRGGKKKKFLIEFFDFKIVCVKPL